MADYRLGMVESQFADIIWEKEPVLSGDLVRICENKLGWKKSTTYTVLRRLCERGIFQNQKGNVTSLISKQEFSALQSEKFINETFDGSLPRFLAAFTARNKLTKEEVEELQRLIDEIGR